MSVPSKFHESAVDEFCSKGYYRFGFQSFLKCLAYLSTIQDYEERPFSINDCYTSFASNGDSQGMTNADKKKQQRRLKKYRSMIADDTIYYDCFSEDEEPHSESRVVFFMEEMIPLNEVNHHLTTQWGFRPDVWSYDDKTLTITLIEVKDCCHLSWDRLKRIAFIDDCLSEWLGLRIQLGEYNISGGNLFWHDLDFVFNTTFDAPMVYKNIVNEDKVDRDNLRAYYQIVNQR